MMTEKIVVVGVLSIVILSIAIPPVYSQEWEPANKILVHKSNISLSSDKTREYPNNWVPWSPDGKYLAISQVEENILIVVNTKNGKTIFSKNYTNNERIWDVKYSPNGKYLATVVNTIDIMDTKTWEIVFSTKGNFLLSWSPDGNYLVYYKYDFENDTHSLIIVSTKNWEALEEIPVGRLPEADISWSPDGRYIAYFESGPVPHDYIRIIDTKTWTTMEDVKMDIGFGMVYALRWSPDSRYLVSANLDTINMTGSISVWNVSTWNLERKIDLGDSIPYSLSWNPDKPILAVGMESRMGNKYIPELKLMSTENWSFYTELKPLNNTELSSLKNNKFDRCYYSVAWSPDGNSLAVAYKDVWVYTSDEGATSPEKETVGSEIPLIPLMGAITGVVIIGGVGVWYWKKKRGS